MSRSLARDSASVEDTERLGEALAPALLTGDVLALSGPLGAGKTRFVAGLARGLSTSARVRSPSFTLVNEYQGRLLLVHLDLYRVDTDELDSFGLEEYAERGVLAVEWGEKLAQAWRAGALQLDFTLLSQSHRRITPSAEQGRGLELLEAWKDLPKSSPTRNRA